MWGRVHRCKCVLYMCARKLLIASFQVLGQDRAEVCLPVCTQNLDFGLAKAGALGCMWGVEAQDFLLDDGQVDHSSSRHFSTRQEHTPRSEVPEVPNLHYQTLLSICSNPVTVRALQTGEKLRQEKGPREREGRNSGGGRGRRSVSPRSVPPLISAPTNGCMLRDLSPPLPASFGPQLRPGR